MFIQMDTQLIQNVISNFETCHFQRDNHKLPDFNYMPASGSNLRKDKAGRSLLGQQYVWALVNWLAAYPQLRMKGYSDNDIYMNVSAWLGNKTPQKENLVRMIVAKLTFGWKSLKRLGRRTSNKGLAYFAHTTDIWQYTFPKELDKLLQEIGKVEAEINVLSEKGVINSAEKTIIENEFIILCNLMNSGTAINFNGFADENDFINIWLISSITKTLKDQNGITEFFSGFVQNP
jgi:hypothetical protein